MCYIDWPLVLEYLKVVLSWPPLALIGVLVFLWRFGDHFAKLIDRIKEIKYPGGSATLEAAQQVESTKGLADVSLPGPAALEHQPANAAIDRSFPADLVPLLPPNSHVEMAIEWAHRNPGPSVKDYVLQMLGYKGERTFNFIFGTQVDLLEYLRTSPGGHTLADLVPFYDKHVLLLDGNAERTIYDYLLFLQNWALIANSGPPDGPLYELAPFGKWFLDYIKQFYSLQWNKRAW